MQHLYYAHKPESTYTNTDTLHIPFMGTHYFGSLKYIPAKHTMDHHGSYWMPLHPCNSHQLEAWLCQRFCDGPFGTVTGVGRIVGRHLRWLHGSPLRCVVLTFAGGNGQKFARRIWENHIWLNLGERRLFVFVQTS